MGMTSNGDDGWTNLWLLFISGFVNSRENPGYIQEYQIFETLVLGHW